LTTQTLSPAVNGQAKQIKQYATDPGPSVQAWEDAIEQLNSIRLDSLSTPEDLRRRERARAGARRQVHEAAEVVP
jgi:hypothetical protein